MQIGHPNTNVQPKTPNATNARNWDISQRYVEQNTQIQNIKDEKASSAEDDNWTPNRIHLITEQINATSVNGKSRNEFFTKTIGEWTTNKIHH